jgi:mannose-6-phosphate isomerase-like protein (cupin superfamily)
VNSSTTAVPLAGNTLAGNEFVIAEWQDSGGVVPPRPIAPLHLHRKDDEAWYVLEGTLVVRAGEKEVRAEVGSAVLVPRGTPHTYWNAGPGRLRYLLVMTPNIHHLIQNLHNLPDRSPAALKAVFEKHDSELL